MMLEEQLKEAAREPKQVSLESKFACSPPICLTAVLPAKAYLRYVSLVRCLLCLMRKILDIYTPFIFLQQVRQIGTG